MYIDCIEVIIISDKQIGSHRQSYKFYTKLITVVKSRVLLGKPEGRRLVWRPRCRWVDNTRMDLGGEPEGKRPLGRPRRRWVNNIRMDLGGEPEGKRPLGRPRRTWVNNIRMDLGWETGGKETTAET